MQLSPPQFVATMVLGRDALTDPVSGPVISVQGTRMYASWTQKLATMLGTSEQLYSIDLGSPGAQELAERPEPQAVGLSSRFPPLVEPATGLFPHQFLAPAVESLMRSTAVNRVPSTLAQPSDEVVLAASVQYATRTRQQYQPTLIYLQDGAVLGYQAITWTDHPLVFPVIAEDAAHQLYLAWNDASGESFQYPVYLATTAPGLQKSWQRLTGDDYVAIAADLANRAVSGVVFFPLAAIWLVISFFALFVALGLSRGDLYGGRGRVVLLGVLWLYWASKYLTTYQIIAYLPFLSYLAPVTGQLLILLVPVLVLMISTALVGLVYIRRAERDYSVMRAYLAIVAIDWVLSLVIYSIGHYE